MSNSMKSHDIDPIKESNKDSNDSNASPPGGESSPESTRKRKTPSSPVAKPLVKKRTKKEKEARKRRLALQKKVGYKPGMRKLMLQQMIKRPTASKTTTHKYKFQPQASNSGEKPCDQTLQLKKKV